VVEKHQKSKNVHVSYNSRTNYDIGKVQFKWQWKWLMITTVCHTDDWLVVGVPYQGCANAVVQQGVECFLYLPEHVQTFQFSHYINQSINQFTGWRKKNGASLSNCKYSEKNGATGHPTSLQIFQKLHDRIAWKLVNFCKIIQLLCDAQIHLYSVNKRQ